MMLLLINILTFHKKMINELEQEKIDELFQKLPEDLQDAIYASETGENAEAICERNKIPELFSFLIDGILSVYIGILPLDKFWEEVGKRIEGKPGTKQILYEIDHFLVMPHRESIEKLYSQANQPATGTVGASQTAT